MTKRQFIEKFTKKEIIEAIVEMDHFCYKNVTSYLCDSLYDKKSNELFDKMDKKLEELKNFKGDFSSIDSITEHIKINKEFEELDKQVNKLMDDYTTLEG